MTLTYRNGLSIGEIIVYSPALLASIYLMIRHGLSRSAGWYFLVIFSLARIIGSSMQLATINDPTSVSLQSGSAILLNIGFSPLMLATLGLLSRLVANIEKSTRMIITTRHLKMIETIISVGLILGIVGGIESGEDASKPPYHYAIHTLTKVSVILFIISYAATVLATILTSFHVPAADAGEHRILYAVGFSLPFLLIRLIYSCFSTFTHNKHFGVLSGSPTVLLCVALLEELIVTVTYLSIGMTLAVVPKPQVGSYEEGGNQSNPPKQDNVVLRIAKRTIIGRLVMALIPSKQKDVEMQTHTEHIQK
ncbi:hypothetical protein GLAREA_06732 [Glarea lozoyensis ATCC 20868]|uniref:DUF7702 domain-containing protein n=1 Tax=Glarea lozoyensis (strain ATCC 20868 / MF5171) TaxID=1116229 RepID=S3D9C5_GLAL2|nr:uncharacterized protein GLAREA_06732 [Glarea lozoyensis ATCC 20868]EPE33719.1 hypothetical protein GLAREA_06732 [Glarea lozoyensis ATCC 20868]